jgi:hypothetical protein
VRAHAALAKGCLVLQRAAEAAALEAAAAVLVGDELLRLSCVRWWVVMIW